MGKNEDEVITEGTNESKDKGIKKGKKSIYSDVVFLLYILILLIIILLLHSCKGNEDTIDFRDDIPMEEITEAGTYNAVLDFSIWADPI